MKTAAGHIIHAVTEFRAAEGVPPDACVRVYQSSSFAAVVQIRGVRGSTPFFATAHLGETGLRDLRRAISDVLAELAGDDEPTP